MRLPSGEKDGEVALAILAIIATDRSSSSGASAAAAGRSAAAARNRMPAVAMRFMGPPIRESLCQLAEFGVLARQARGEIAHGLAPRPREIPGPLGLELTPGRR